jgi:hypothetical protein
MAKMMEKEGEIEEERVPGRDAESRQRDEQVRRMCSTRYFTAGQTVAEGLWMLVVNNRGGRSSRGEYLHDRLSRKGISNLFAEAGAVGFCHD